MSKDEYFKKCFVSPFKAFSNPKKEYCKKHLMTNFYLLDSPIYLLGLNKLYSYYRGVLTRKDIEKVLFKFEKYSLNQDERISKKTNTNF